MTEGMIQMWKRYIYCLFVWHCREEDVTVTMYTTAYNRAATSTPGKISKVDTICDAVRNILETLGPDR